MMRFRVVNHLLVEQRPPLPDEMPFEVRLLPQAETQDEIQPWMIINHTQAASRSIPMDQAWNTDKVRTDGIESHLLADQLGRGMQCMPFNIVAHTSYRANRFWIPGVGWCGQVSVESQDDGGSGLANDPWTPPQFEFLCQAWAAVCVCPDYQIPVQPVPAWNGRGVSQHNAFPEWSKSAHSCPGPARTAQMPAMRARITQIIAEDSHPIVLPSPTGELAMKIFQPSDCDAEFMGLADANGNVPFLTWIETAEQQRSRDEYIANGAEVDHGPRLVPGDRSGFRNCTLLGPLPRGDTRHAWVPGDFFRVIPAAA